MLPGSVTRGEATGVLDVVAVVAVVDGDVDRCVGLGFLTYAADVRHGL